MVLNLNKLESPSLKGLVEIDPVVLEKKVLKFCLCIFAISKLSPLGKSGALRLNKLESPSTKDALCQFG